MTLVDTNILLDLLTDDPKWAAWSLERLDASAFQGDLVINAVIYADLAVRFASVEELDAVIEKMNLVLTPMPRAALFLAAKAFGDYRARGGSRSSVPPDFFIGAHAAVMRYPLLTRDAGRYRSYFPTIELMTP